jgi:mannose-6-phosphate isomerase-like protein (cupin superfamily)
MAETAVSNDTEKRRKQRRSKTQRLRPPQAFRYENPGRDAGKTMVNIAQSDVVRGLVQVVKAGEGDNNLHLHTGMDSVWFVLKGRVRFYGPDDLVIGEYGPHEGILMPRNNPYWFAAVGDVDLELLQVIGMHPDVKNERVDLEERKWQVNTTEHLDGRILEDA